MTESIKEIFGHNIRLLGDLDKAVYFFREQEYEKALSLTADNIELVREVIEAIISDQEYFNLVSTDEVLQMLTGILEAKKNRDYILLADLLELQLISFLIGVQELIIGKEEMIYEDELYSENTALLLEHARGITGELLSKIDTEKLLESGYRIEFTSGGQMTLAADNDGNQFYFHSNHIVRKEAALLAEHWYDRNKNKYIVYGFGLGYHIYELAKLAGDADIEVYEADKNVLQLACAFTDMREGLKGSRIRLIYDPEFVSVRQKIAGLTAQEAFYIHYPSYKNIRSDAGKEALSSIYPWSKAIEE